MRVHEATTEKKALAKQQLYEPRKPQNKALAREELKELIAIPNIAERLKCPRRPTRGWGLTKMLGACSTKRLATPYATVSRLDTS